MRIGTPTTRIAAAMAFPFVQQERTYSRSPMPSRIFSRTNDWGAAMARAWTLAMVVLLPVLRALALGRPAAPGERVKPHQERGPQGHHERRSAERAGDEARDVLLRDVRAERELPDVDVGDVQPARPAGLVLALHVLHVLAGVRVDAGLRELEHLGARAERERAGRAHLGAR